MRVTFPAKRWRARRSSRREKHPVRTQYSEARRLRLGPPPSEAAAADGPHGVGVGILGARNKGLMPIETDAVSNAFETRVAFRQHRSARLERHFQKKAVYNRES